MLQKIVYTIFGVAIALLFFPRAARDSNQQNQLTVLGLSTGSYPASPELASSVTPPNLSSKAAMAYDLDSGTILFTQNFDEQLPIASLTKLMTAMVAAKNSQLDEAVMVKHSDVKVVGSSMGLVPGERISVRDLLYGVLISSSNDASLALANHKSPTEEFIAAMNEEAKRLNLQSTKFSNPVGWDYADNYSTAHDLSLLVNEFLKYEELSRIVRIKEAELRSLDGKYSHKLTTTNKLLIDNDAVTGIKTGFTSQAKGNLVLRIENHGRSIITIILGSDDREGDSKKLLDWITQVYRW
ncbi:MAG: D-alanyl-D-alanine carboxypeptidase [Candidatus Doudnabacteria bacterium]|nr:D-alanyl-D-alanine carboxypeptidase [Candidatus Doudnabacteria bacterium]